MARPSKLTADLQRRVVEAISLGATLEHAAQYGPIDYATLRRWVVAGEKNPGTPYGDFRMAVLEAEARAVVVWLAQIEKAARDGDWRAAAWKLERRHPQIYGRSVHELTGANGGPLEVRPVDYRTLVAPLTSGPVADQPAPREDEGPRDGEAVG